MTDANDTGVPPAEPVIVAATRHERPRLVYESAALSPDDIADDAERRADAYGHPDSEHVVVVDGFGARVVVERGHLELHDGVGEHRRVRRYAKVDAPRRVVVGIGTVGALSLRRPAVVRQGRDLGRGARRRRRHPGRRPTGARRRPAAPSPGARPLRAGRAWRSPGISSPRSSGARPRCSGLHLWEDDAASTFVDLMRGGRARPALIDEIRQPEAAAANVYFAAWERTVVVTLRPQGSAPDTRALAAVQRPPQLGQSGEPAQRHRPGRSGPQLRLQAGRDRSRARRPAYGSSDPAIGILHADVRGGRRSPATSWRRCARWSTPMCSAVLSGPLRKREFTEDARGVVRCLAPITHRLAEAMPSYAVALGPVVETRGRDPGRGFALRRERADGAQRGQAQGGGPSPGGCRAPSDHNSPGRRSWSQLRGDEATEASSYQAISEPAVAVAILPWVRRPVAGRERQGHGPDRVVPELSGRAPGGGWLLPSRSGTSRPPCASPSGPELLPTHTPEARASRSASMRAQRMAQSAYEPRITRGIDPEWYGATVQPLWRVSPCRPSPRPLASRPRLQRNGVPVEQPRTSGIGLRWRSWLGSSCPR